MDESLEQLMRNEKWVEALVHVEERIVAHGETDELLGAKVKILHALGEDDNALAVMRQIASIPSVDPTADSRGPADSFDDAAAHPAQLASMDGSEPLKPQANPQAAIVAGAMAAILGMGIFVAIVFAG